LLIERQLPISLTSFKTGRAQCQRSRGSGSASPPGASPSGGKARSAWGLYFARIPMMAALMIMAVASAMLQLKVRPLTTISRLVEASGVM
jgi:hypothetical protein